MSDQKELQAIAKYLAGCGNLKDADFIRGIAANLATAEADAGRLDWLDRNLQMKTGWRVGVAKAGNIVITSVGLSETTIRDAIDTARGAK